MRVRVSVRVMFRVRFRVRVGLGLGLRLGCAFETTAEYAAYLHSTCIFTILGCTHSRHVMHCKVK